MSIVVSDETKKQIEKFIHEYSIESSFKSSFIKKALQDLDIKNELNQFVARKILEELYIKGETLKDVITPDREFEERFDEAISEFDNIPKPDDYGSFEKSNLSEGQLLKSIEKCLALTELSDEFYTVQNTRKVAKEVVNSIDFLNKNNIGVGNGSKEKLNTLTLKLQTLLAQETTDVNSLKTGIDVYNDSAMQIWNDFLSDPSKEDGVGNYLVYTFNKGKFSIDPKEKSIHTSLITKDAMGIKGKSGFGYILKPKHIIAADLNNANILKKFVRLDNVYNSNVINNISQKYIIKPPQQIEAEMVKMSESVNGEILNSDNVNIHSDVVVDDYEIDGIFLMTNGEKELNPYYKKAIELAKEKNVPFKEIDISEQRKERGLAPLSTEMKKQLCQKILYTYSKNERYEIPDDYYPKFASYFIEENYEDFAERFLAIKSQDNYTSEMIENEFRKMILDDAIDSKYGISILNKERISFFHGFFLKKLTEDEFKYILSNRYDFSKCKSVREFEQRYFEFKNSVVQKNHFKSTKEALDELFPGKESLKNKELSYREFQELFDSKNTSINSIIGYVQNRDNPEEKLSIMRKIARKVSSSTFLSNLPIIKSFTKEKHPMLPESTQETKEFENKDSKNNRFMQGLKKEMYSQDEIIKNDTKLHEGLDEKQITKIEKNETAINNKDR